MALWERIGFLLMKYIPLRVPWYWKTTDNIPCGSSHHVPDALQAILVHHESCQESIKHVNS